MKIADVGVSISFDTLGEEEEQFKTYPKSVSQSNQSYKQNVYLPMYLLTSWRYYIISNDLSGGHIYKASTEVINSRLIEHGSERVEQIW